MSARLRVPTLLLLPHLILFLILLSSPAHGDAVLGNIKMATNAVVLTDARHVAGAVQQLRGDAAVNTALLAVGLGTKGGGSAKKCAPGGSPQKEVHEQLTAGAPPANVRQLLEDFGLQTALDLQLLAGGPEADELMNELRLAGKLSLGDRAKIRLLIGDTAHMSRLFGCGAVETEIGTRSRDHPRTRQAAPVEHERRQMQGTGTHISIEALAIVFSVMVGAIGYAVQAYTARRSEQAAVERAHEQHEADAAKERLHQQVRHSSIVYDLLCAAMSDNKGVQV
eukprot:SAG31_NODE_1698_length_7500_cov_3.644778_7_plen_281_part_00